MSLTLRRRVWRILIAITILLSIAFFTFFYFSSIFITLVIGLSLIILTKRLATDYTSRMCRYDYPAWKCKMYGILLAIFWIIVAIFILSRSVQDMGEVISEVSARNTTITDTFVSHAEKYLPQALTSRVSTQGLVSAGEQYVITFMSDIFAKLSAFLFNAVLIIPLMFYVYYRKWGSIKRKIYELIPDKFSKGFRKAARKISKQMNEYLTAKVLESTVIGGLCCLGFYVAGLKGWLVLGLLAGFLNIIPYIGPLIGAIPPILIALLDEPRVALYVIITVVIAQLIDNLYLIPFMISGKVRVDALLGIFITLVGAQLAGPMGMIFAIPIYLVYRITLTEVYKQLVNIYDEE